MFVIAHRGGAGLAPENTLKSLQAGKQAGADALECDIQITKDSELILCHDDTLLRIAGKSTKIADLTLKEINLVVTHSGEPIPTLAEALETAGDTPLVIEGKGTGWAKPLAKELSAHVGTKPMVISGDHPELFIFSKEAPGYETFAINDHAPFNAIHSAKLLGLSGISTGFSHYNPFLYWYCKRYNLRMITSPINKPRYVRFFHFFYPQVMITTDFPNKIKGDKHV